MTDRHHQKTIYICPMHPEVVKNAPGRCPACGMELIPLAKGKAEHAGHGMQKMPARQSPRLAEASGEAQVGDGGSHADHERAMTDPQMAKEMERDMRRRFFVSLALTIPIVLYSPMGEMLFGLSLPSPIPKNLLLFLLTTPIVFWAGSIFITGTYYSLKARKLNMAVLIATGVLAAYLGSIALAFYDSGEAFYEAAAMLVTFVLFGHWMEMKSRRFSCPFRPSLSL
ncbi:MAG: heavy metal-binding domain-containing protein [bacterium]|nr:heavy metal-binding domain-containing protein [bacterium]